jgi:hypothetical protein
MAWTTFFATEQAKLDLHEFLRQGGGELYVWVGVWGQGLLIQVQKDLQSRDPGMQLVRAGPMSGRGRVAGWRAGGGALPQAQWTRTIQFEGDFATLCPIFSQAPSLVRPWGWGTTSPASSRSTCILS